jgi:trehalose/maltose transport system permease protein
VSVSRPKQQRWLGSLGVYLATALILCWSLFPLAWAMLTSLKSGSALFDPNVFATPFVLSNYAAVFRGQPFGRNIVNSGVVAVAVVAIGLAVAVPAAYALGRVRWRGRGLMLAAILGASMFPQVAVLGGMFELIRHLGLYNSLAALVLSYLTFTVPFTVWVLTTYMRDLPRELEEAAVIDGCSPPGVLWRVLLPLLRPAMAATGLLAFIAAWNEFLFALSFTATDAMRTVPVAIALFSGASSHELPWGNMMAASVIVTLPLVLLVLLCQRLIVSGLTAGALKG